MDDSHLTEEELKEEYKVAPADNDATTDPSNFDVELNKPFSLGSQNSLYSLLAKGDSPANEQSFNIRDDDFAKSLDSEGQQTVDKNFENFDPMNLAKNILTVDELKGCINVLGGAGVICAGAGLKSNSEYDNINDAIKDGGHGLNSTGLEPTAGIAFEIKF